MTDLEIVNKFFEETKKDRIHWKKSADSFLNSYGQSSFVTQFVGNDYVKVCPMQYTDVRSYTTKSAYKMEFYDGQHYCYKTISETRENETFVRLRELYKLINESVNALDSKLSSFFKNL